MPKGTLASIAALLLLLVPSSALADVAQIGFTSSPQTVAPGDLSGALTIQTQDVSGASSKTTETIDLEFLSSSPTGQFLSTSGGTLTKSMSSNTSNKNFAYKDPVEGTYSLTVNATGRTSGKRWSATQTITVAASTQGSGTTDTGAASSTNQAAQDTSDSNSIPSSHYSFVPISDTPVQKYTVSAGRDRLGYVGVPLVFKALPNTDDPNADYRWSFGDGDSDGGRGPIHTYAYPGTYDVVLNAKLFEYEAVARVRVVIVPANVSISEANEQYIALKNNSEYEANLYGWRISQGIKTFEFPKDTIIEPGQTIKIPSAISTFKPLNISDVALEKSATPVRQDAVSYPVRTGQAKLPDDRSQRLAAAGEALSRLEAQVYLLAQKEQSVPKAAAARSPVAALAVPTTTASSAPRVSWVSTLKLFFFGKK